MSDTRPNILLITTDQQRWDTIHAAGNAALFTPHLNFLCDTGVRFTRAYTDCPVCMPARATLMTGVPAYRHGAVGNSQQEPIRGRPTIPELLTAAGYETRAQGKMHFHPMRKKYGFETMELSTDYYTFMRRHFPSLVGAQHGQGQNELEPVIGSTDENHTLTRWVIDRSIDFLETRDAERPFFLWTSISKPHPPLDPSLKFWELLRDAEIPPPIRSGWSADFNAIPAGFAEPSIILSKGHRFSPAQWRQIRRAYYACIAEVDSNLGRLFCALREMGLFRNTWIFFTSDHGEMLGDHNLSAKSVFFEGSAHVPLLMRPAGEWDEEPLRGVVCDELACLQDFLPTMLNLAGISDPLPPSADGCDLRALASGQHHREMFTGQCGPLYARIEGFWKYTYSARDDAALLFEMSTDPDETCNLAAQESGRCRDMHSRMVDELVRSGSPHVADGRILPQPGLSPGDTLRLRSWPGFHANSATNTDLLH